MPTGWFRGTVVACSLGHGVVLLDGISTQSLAAPGGRRLLQLFNRARDIPCRLRSQGGLPVCLPVPGQEFVQTGLRQVGDPIEDLRQPRLRVNIVEGVVRLTQTGSAVGEQRAAIDGDVAESLRQAELAIEIMDGGRAHCVRCAQLAVEVVDGGTAERLRGTDLAAEIVNGRVTDPL